MYQTKHNPDVVFYLKDNYLWAIKTVNPLLMLITYKVKVVESLEGLQLDSERELRRIRNAIEKKMGK